MDRKMLDHSYHRSRVDAQMGGGIAFILLMLALSFLVGDKFKLFQQGAENWTSTLLVWDTNTKSWMPVHATTISDWESGTGKPILTKEIHPRSFSLVVVLGSLVAAYFLYACARRQARLMRSVYDEDDSSAPYDRQWGELRVTFWGMFIVLLGTLFLFVM
ncbi:MAG: hypothetical protein GY842_24310 [bacterium]|nr:hypothetical protein [bacterium]